MSDKGESKCPVDHTKQQIQVNTTSENTTAKCPSANHSKFYGGKINPLNNMPEDLSQSLPGAQQANLPKEREISSIPRSDGQNGENWEYPSPQQFFNALSRKGMPVGEEHVETMVHIHNFLNEGAWDEVLRWEKRIDNKCKIHRLTRLQGRPNEPSPKARFFSTFFGTKPFDRHDWYVDRCGKEVRYVIDYYELPSEDGNPAFSLDVRPALDSFEALFSRISMFFSSKDQ